MLIDMDALVRRLLLLGLPLLPAAGCSVFGTSSCSDPPKPVDMYVEIENPSRGAGGSPGGPASLVTAAAYDRCAEVLDCTELCMQYFSFGAVVHSCGRVATDGFAGADERLALQARLTYYCEGRRPEGQGAPPPPARAACEVGAYLARAAYLEGVSVPAFRRLARELAAHGAPPALVRQARRAAGDEVRHHRAMTSLARWFGAEPPAVPRAFPDEVRSLEAVAVENAAEGCMRETIGALVAREQAGRAGDPVVRAAMRGIAADEARHAELAFQVDGWARGKLGAAARGRVRRAWEAEAETVAREVEAGALPAEVTAVAGVPGDAVMRAMVAGLRSVVA